MKVTANRKELIKLLNNLKTVLPRKSLLPITTHIYLEAKDGKLYCRATNLEEYLMGVVEAGVEAAGSVCAQPCIKTPHLRGLLEQPPLLYQKSRR